MTMTDDGVQMFKLRREASDMADPLRLHIDNLLWDSIKASNHIQHCPSLSNWPCWRLYTDLTNTRRMKV